MRFFTLASVALSAAVGASAIVVPRHHTVVARHEKEKPATYAEGYLENYQTYHLRYLALDCEDKHGTPYFDACCHPMLATETLAKNRAAECNPANLPSSTSSAAVSLQTGDDGEDCEDDEPTTTASSAAPTSTDDEEDCEDDEPTSSAAPTSTHVATSTRSSSTHPTSTHVSTSSRSSSTHTTSTHTTSKTSSAAPKPTGGSGGDFEGGHATFFYQGGQAGACGKVHPDSSLIAALQTKRYGNLDAESSNCGRQITLTNKNNGKSVTVTVADACPSCKDENDLDLSYAAFTSIATEEEGYVPIEWHFNN